MSIADEINIAAKGQLDSDGRALKMQKAQKRQNGIGARTVRSLHGTFNQMLSSVEIGNMVGDKNLSLEAMERKEEAVNEKLEASPKPKRSSDAQSRADDLIAKAAGISSYEAFMNDRQMD